jgi:predicted nicotinamide N-methyase
MPTTTDHEHNQNDKLHATTQLKDNDHEDEDDSGLLMGSAALFEEPEGFRPPPDPPTIKIFERRVTNGSGPKSLDLQLVGQHSLWAHQ